MIRVLALLCALSPAWGAIAFVQAQSGGSTSATAVTTGVLGSVFTVGNLVVVRAGFRNSCATATISISDNGSGGSNAYTQIGGYLDNTSNMCTSMWYTKVARAAASSQTVTMTTTASVVNLSLTAMEFSGFTTAAVDATATGTNASNGIATTASYTTTAANELLVAGPQTFSSETPTFPVPTSPGTWIQPANAADPFSASGSGAYQIVSSTQSGVTTTLTATNGTVDSIMVATFKNAAGGGGSVGAARRRVVQE